MYFTYVGQIYQQTEAAPIEPQLSPAVTNIAKKSYVGEILREMEL